MSFIPTQYKLQIELAEKRRPDGSVGLLVPVPPTTPHQKLKSLVLDPSWSGLPVTAQSGAQSAIFATLPCCAGRRPIEMKLINDGFVVENHFGQTDGAAAAADDDARQLAQEIGLPDSCCEIDGLEKIIDALSRKFRYQSGHTNDAPLTCDLLTGNCLSINEAFLRMTRIADIKSAYYIGYFFGSSQPLSASDWHCWVSTSTARGYESWDIAHHLKRGLKRIRPALNPVPGVRFAMSVGRDLVFGLPFGRVKVSSLCEPRWIFRDGASKRCEVRVTVDEIHLPATAIA